MRLPSGHGMGSGFPSYLGHEIPARRPTARRRRDRRGHAGRAWRAAGRSPSASAEPGPALPEALPVIKFLPAGRILAGAGTGRAVTLFNCFVMGTIPDDLAGIFAHLREAALTMQQGGGIGYDFSTLRPKGAR